MRTFTISVVVSVDSITEADINIECEKAIMKCFLNKLTYISDCIPLRAINIIQFYEFDLECSTTALRTN